MIYNYREIYLTQFCKTKLKICNISNININEIKLCSNYIFFNI